MAPVLVPKPPKPVEEVPKPVEGTEVPKLLPNNDGVLVVFAPKNPVPKPVVPVPPKPAPVLTIPVVVPKRFGAVAGWPKNGVVVVVLPNKLGVDVVEAPSRMKEKLINNYWQRQFIGNIIFNFIEKLL